MNKSIKTYIISGKWSSYYMRFSYLQVSKCLSYTYYHLIACMFLITTFASCKKLVDIKAPVTSINEANVYANDATAISVLTGVYANMSSNTISFTGLQSISVLSGLSSDELVLYPGFTRENFIAYYKNALVSNPTQNFGSEHWTSLYSRIFICNAAIEGLNKSNSLTPSVKQQLLGEAKFLRGFFYFYLVNMYGDLPLILTTDYVENSSMSRSSTADIYKQIIADLKDAQDQLSADYLNGSLQKYSGSMERLRPTKWSAAAMLARVYLYNNDWANAETSASLVTNNSGIFSLSSLDNAFLKASLANNEAIWQLQPIRTGRNTEDALTFIIPSNGPNDNNPVFLSSQLLNSFESGDQRKSRWINSTVAGGLTYYYPYKYKVNTINSQVTEYLMMLRLGEQYLIRSEARAHLNKLSEAIADLDMIRQRAGLPLIANTNPGISQSALLDKILHERQVELFTELGQRWFDLKRSGKVDVVMTQVTPLKGGTWQSYQQLYPLLYSDIQKDVNLKQNPGY